MKKLFFKLLKLSIVVLLLGYSLFYVFLFIIPNAFDENFQKGLTYQYRCLVNADKNKPKIIIFGGSYAIFATDPDYIEAELGMPVYQFGMNSAIGMQYLYETVDKYSNPGDIVITPFFDFEKDDYGMNELYITFENQKDMFMDFYKDNPIEVIRSCMQFPFIKLVQMQKNFVRKIMKKKKIYKSPYSAYSFDKETSRFVYDRTNYKGLLNRGIKYHNSATSNVSDYCFNYINKFNEKCNKKGVKFYMTYPPSFDQVQPDADELKKCLDNINNKLNVEFLLSYNDCIYTEEYIYDAILHLNNKGAEIYSNKMVNALKERK